MADAAQAFSMLVTLARGTTAAALPLPAQEQQGEVWRGLGFNVASTRLVSAIGDVEEVLEVPPLTRVPGTSDWLLGIANVRGRIVPVADLCAYLGLEKTAPEEEWRMLVVEQGELIAGLLVEQAFGMMQFELGDADAAEDIALGNGLDPYLRAGYRQSGRHWRVIDLEALVQQPAFFQVGV